MKKKVMICLVLSVLLSSCAIKKDFLLSPVVPAARGNVKIDTDRNKNYSIRVHVFNLAEPSRVDARKNTYVVWMETGQNEIKNLGQIKSSKSLFSKAMKATLETNSPFKPTRVFITAESNGDVKIPDSQIVLSTENF